MEQRNRICECPIFFLCIDVANKSDRDVVDKFQRSSGLEKHAYARESEDYGYSRNKTEGKY